jgi:hypothetical protein
MRSTHPVPRTADGGSSGTRPKNQGSAAPASSEGGIGDRAQAAQGPIPEPVSAAGQPASPLPAHVPAEAWGRRTFSTAFVMVGPDGHLTVELRDGRVLVLRDVIMRDKGYCGVQVLGDLASKRYCGGYADIAAARPGGGPGPEGPKSDASNPFEPALSRSKHK